MNISTIWNNLHWTISTTINVSHAKTPTLAGSVLVELIKMFRPSKPNNKQHNHRCLAAGSLEGVDSLAPAPTSYSARNANSMAKRRITSSESRTVRSTRRTTSNISAISAVTSLHITVEASTITACIVMTERALLGTNVREKTTALWGSSTHRTGQTRHLLSAVECAEN